MCSEQIFKGPGIICCYLFECRFLISSYILFSPITLSYKAFVYSFYFYKEVYFGLFIKFKLVILNGFIDYIIKKITVKSIYEI